MIYSIEQMVSWAVRCHPIVLCHGVFDILHVGHIRYLKSASEFGFVFVTITPDKYVNKGEGRPAFPEDIRAEVVDSIKNVECVAVNKWPTAVEAIELIRPDFYAKGGEYEGNKTDALLREEQAIERVGGKMVYIHDELGKQSSTELWRKYAKGL